MKFKVKVNSKVKTVLILAMVLGLIAFAERMKEQVVVRDIKMDIRNVADNHFVDEQDIMKLMEANEANVIGVNIETLSFKAIEDKIRRNPFIRDAELYSDLKGNVTVKVDLRRPIARIVQPDGADGYIAEDGTIMPVSDRFSSRVILLSGAVRKLLVLQNLFDEPQGERLMSLLKRIHGDEFWNAQIAELSLDEKGRITFYTQVGDERIEFGRPEEIDEKLKKLEIFYKEVLPRVGWNKYDRVNLEYEGQIVAE